MKPEEINDLFIDRPDNNTYQVNRKVFTDEELFDLEMKHIFEANWVYLCHESQIANPNDFFTTHMGRQPVVVSRDNDGVIHAFINACRHRGAEVCKTAKGNKRFHVCPYHGWTYDSSGKSVDVKDRAGGGYPDEFLNASHDLEKVAKVETYAGFVFGSFNSDVKTLVDHLGAAGPFLEMLELMSAEGAEVLKGSSTYLFRGNWKMQAENGIDGYHFTTIHENYVGVLMRRGKLAQQGKEDKVKMAFDDSIMNIQNLNNGSYDLNNGHALLWGDFPVYQNRPLWQSREEVIARVGETKAHWMLRRQRNLLVFPNVQIMEQASSQIRVFRPINPGLTEVKIYCIAAKNESKGQRASRIRQYEDFFNASGMATPDDLDVFERCQKGFNANRIKWQQGYDRGAVRVIQGADKWAKELGIEPYSSCPDVQDEILYHGQYREWKKRIGEGLEKERIAEAD